MQASRIRGKLSTGRPAFITTLNLPDDGLFKLVSLMGFDGSVENIADPFRVGGQAMTKCGIDGVRFARPKGPGYVFYRAGFDGIWLDLEHLVSLPEFDRSAGSGDLAN